jgi:transposase
MEEQSGIRRRHEILQPLLDERSRRLVLAAEAAALGRGGITAVARATGASRPMIARGISEIESTEQPLPKGRIRRSGAGRKRTAEQDPSLLSDLEGLIDPMSRGEPDSALRWTIKSVRRLSDELVKMGHRTSHRMVAEMLHELGYSLQANRKVREGDSHPDRNAQFEYIHAKVKAFQAARDPVVSVDTKKKELVGDFKNVGRELRPKGDPEMVRTHDFPLPELGKATPYGVYDLNDNSAWVSVGVDHDTGQFAVETLRRWWYAMGHPAYPEARRLLITADCGGSNGSRLRLWKWELQRLAEETGLEISLAHFPPGTSKWNKIEHRLFSFITQNWRGKPLISHEVIVNLIAATTTRTGLRVQSALDLNSYESGIRISKQQMEELNIRRDEFHGEWNYTILPAARTESGPLIS